MKLALTRGPDISMQKAAAVPEKLPPDSEAKLEAKPTQAKTGNNTSRSILIGLALGIVTGLFFGEKVAFLQWPARAFVELLQVTVLPYIVCSMIVGIGENTGSNARQLAAKGGLILVVTWILSLAIVFAVPLALPPEKGGVFFSAAPSREASIDWLDLYIPANPFRSLANNTVPAVVIFSILVGIALTDLKGKEKLLEPLKAFSKVLGRVASLMVRLTPFGIFAISGHAAGTLRLDEFARLQAFLLIYIGLSLILAFWLLPGLVSLITSIPHKRMISLSMDAVLTAFVTSNVFVVLPLIAERSKQLISELSTKSESQDDSIDVLIPASFNFPHSGKILSMSFILFAGWFAGTPVSKLHYPILGGAGFLSFFGSLNTAIPFLLNLLRIPADLFQMFLVSGIINSQFGSAAAVMHTMTVAVIGAFLMSRPLRLHMAKLLRFAMITALIVGGFLVGSRVLLSNLLPAPGENNMFYYDQLKLSGVWGELSDEAKIDDEMPDLPADGAIRGERLNQILKRKLLRVGYTDDALPWSFRNSRGELVGFDIDMAHALAVLLEVHLELVPITRANMGQMLNSGMCDIVMSGIRATPLRAKTMQFSEPYVEEASAFLVLDHMRDSFQSVESIQKLKGVRIAVLNITAWMQRLEHVFPQAKLTPIDSIEVFLNDRSGRFDATYTGWERAAALSMIHPKYSPVVPEPGMGSTPLAYAVPKYEEDLLTYVNTWIAGRRASGLMKERLDYWVNGKGAGSVREPRWSIAGIYSDCGTDV